jgi:flavocytochrome c
VLLVVACHAQTVIVVGSGLAGLSAAIEAARNGASVTILEKEARVGGNSLCASSGMNAVATPPQREEKIVDNVENFVKDTLKSGKGLSNKKLVALLANQSRIAWDFLTDFGVDLRVLCKTGGHSIARTHRAHEKEKITSIGTDIIQALLQAIKKEYPTITIVTDARVTALIFDEKNGVTGVRYATTKSVNSTCQSKLDARRQELVEKCMYADAIILATGGFCGDVVPGSMLAQYRPDLLYLATTNGGFANGDGIMLAHNIGAQLVDMDKIQIHPTGFVNPRDPFNKHKFLAPESLRASGGILINHTGRRFVNELDTRDIVTQAILANCVPYQKPEGPLTAYLVLNEAGAQLFQKRVLEFYMRYGLIQRFDSAKSFARTAGFDEGTFVKTLESYAAAARVGNDEFGKVTFPITISADEPVYSMLITPCLHYCMGGIVFDECARVIGRDGPIAHLFAAGEVTGGLHGANRLAGNSLLECVVFGRIAGRNAAIV